MELVLPEFSSVPRFEPELGFSSEFKIYSFFLNLFELVRTSLYLHSRLSKLSLKKVSVIVLLLFMKIFIITYNFIVIVNCLNHPLLHSCLVNKSHYHSNYLSILHHSSFSNFVSLLFVNNITFNNLFFHLNYSFYCTTQV